MKKTLLVATILSFLATAPAVAQTMGSGGMQSGMMEDRQQQAFNRPGQANYQQMQAGTRANMMMATGQNMMGGYGMMGGRNMMNMMMGNSGMMPMMGGYGMMPGMMGGYGMMQDQGPDELKKYENFVKETRDSRKKLHDLMFEYGEARWNPATTLGDLRKMAEEMHQLRKDIQKKMEQ
jgi:hypothetical protein